MYPFKHLLYGIIFSGSLFVLFPGISLIGLVLFIASTVLIDVDHYLYYVYKTKDINFKRARKWFFDYEKKFLEIPFNERNQYRWATFCFLHGIETILLVFILGFYFNQFFFVFAGISFHLLLDWVHQSTYWDKRMERVSILYDYFKFKKLTLI